MKKASFVIILVLSLFGTGLCQTVLTREGQHSGQFIQTSTTNTQVKVNVQTSTTARSEVEESSIATTPASTSSSSTARIAGAEPPSTPTSAPTSGIQTSSEKTTTMPPADIPDYKQICGINLQLETNFKRRLGVAEESTETRVFSPSENYPWVVSYGESKESGEWEHKCGGSIISEEFVLTAYHCAKKFNEGYRGEIRAGDSDLNTTEGDSSNVQVRRVEAVSHHPQYVEGSAFYDIAVLRVDPPFKFTNTVRKICIPKKELPNPDVRQGQAVKVAGYGKPSWGKLGDILMTIRPESFCKSIYESPELNELRNSKKNTFERKKREASKKLTPEEVKQLKELAIQIIPDKFNTSLMCIGSELKEVGACDGDNGGPGFIFNTSKQEHFTQIGVFHGSVGCGLPAYPDVYVRLDDKSVLDFVQTEIEKKVKINS